MDKSSLNSYHSNYCYWFLLQLLFIKKYCGQNYDLLHRKSMKYRYTIFVDRETIISQLFLYATRLTQSLFMSINNFTKFRWNHLNFAQYRLISNSYTYFFVVVFSCMIILYVYKKLQQKKTSQRHELCDSISSHFYVIIIVLLLK